MGSSSSRSTNPEYQEPNDTDEIGQVPNPGDLIEIFCGGYKHWALYVGGGNVVHFVVNGCGLSSSSGFSRLPAPGEMGVVMKEKLQEVVAGDRWRIDNFLDKKYKPKQIYAIVKEACQTVGARLPYDLVTSNCEHFVNDLRYGKKESRQVVNAAAGFGAIAALVAVLGTVIGVATNIRS